MTASGTLSTGAGRTALITGAVGFTGRHLALALRRQALEKAEKFIQQMIEES